MAAEDRSFRSFETQIGVLARVTVRGRGWSYEPLVDPTSGLIEIPVEQTYQGIASAADMRTYAPVESFTLEIARGADDDRVVIAQRAHGDRYFKTAVSSTLGGLVLHSFPPCEVKTRARSAMEMKRHGIKNPLSVWCNTMQSAAGSSGRRSLRSV